MSNGRLVVDFNVLFHTDHNKLLLATLSNAWLARILLRDTSGPMKEQHSETAGAVCTCVASKWHYPARKKATQALVSPAEKGKNNKRSAVSNVSPTINRFCMTQHFSGKLTIWNQWIRHAILSNGKLAVAPNLLLINLIWGDSQEGNAAEKMPSLKSKRLCPLKMLRANLWCLLAFTARCLPLWVSSDIFSSLIPPDVFSAYLWSWWELKWKHRQVT